MSPIINFLDAAIVQTSTLQHLARTRLEQGGRERGSVTIEQVLWAVAVIAIVGIVVAAITNYVTSRAGEIR